MNHLESNLDLLSRRQPELALHLRQIAFDNVEVLPSAAGIPTIRYSRGGSGAFLHSRYDPMREARQLVQKADLAGADYFILLGFGLGYMLDALLERYTGPDNHCFVVESNPAILKAAFASRDLRKVLSLPHLHFAWPAAGPGLAAQWRSFFDPVRAQKSAFIHHPSSVALNPAYYESAVELIQSQTFQIFTDINTLVGKSQAFLDNFVQNLPHAMRAPGVAAFAGRFSGIPAVLVSAGPSLDKNIHELRLCADRLLILSTDTALKPLLAAGVEPHFVLTGDPSYENYLHLKGSSPAETFLVAEATTYPGSLQEFEDRTVMCVFENSSLRAFSDLLSGKGTLRAWGSVATLALDFALVLGCNPILFIGQDLAHSDGRTYCSGLHFEEEWFQGISSPEEWQAVWKRIGAGRPTVTMRDIFGHPVETTDKLAAYWNWILKEISNHPEVRFINATEGGILRDQVELMSLREALYRCCRKDLGLRHLIKSIFLQAKENYVRSSGIALQALKQESIALSRILQQGIAVCKDASQIDPRNLFHRLETVKETIYTNKHVAPVVDSFNQMGNVTFLRRQAGLAGRPVEASLINDIRDTYLEYFNTVQQSLQKIDAALVQISKAIN